MMSAQGSVGCAECIIDGALACPEPRRTCLAQRHREAEDRQVDRRQRIEEGYRERSEPMCSGWRYLSRPLEDQHYLAAEAK